MLDRDHLDLLDVTVRRNAFGRQLASFEAELDWEGGAAAGDLHPRALGRGRGRRRGGAGRGGGPSCGGAPGQHPGRVLPSRVDRRAPSAPLAARACESHASMRDHRADALAQILVRYSTQVSKGDVCVIQSTTAAEVLVQAIYEEVLRAGGLPVMQLTSEGAKSAFFELAGPEQLDWVPPRHLGGRERRRTDRRDGRRQRARALEDRPQEAGACPESAQGADGDLDEALGRGRIPLVADPVSHARLRQRGGHVAARLRGLLLRGLPGHGLRPAHRLAAPVRPGEPSRRMDRGQGGGAHQGPGTDITLGTGGPALDPLRRASTTCPTASFSPGRSRTRSTAR